MAATFECLVGRERDEGVVPWVAERDLGHRKMVSGYPDHRALMPDAYVCLLGPDDERVGGMGRQRVCVFGRAVELRQCRADVREETESLKMRFA